MDRVKVEIKSIENNTNRQATFSKRRNGLIKKAYELSTLCDIDIALVMFSPSSRLSLFSGRKKITDVFSRLVYFSDQEPENTLASLNQDKEHFCRVLHNKEHLISTLNRLRCENDVAPQATNPAAISSEIEELEKEIRGLQQQLQMAEEHLRNFEPDSLKMTSMEELESCERHLENTLACVMDRKKYLLGNLLSSYDPRCLEEMPTSFQNGVCWSHDKTHNQTHLFDPLRDNLPTMYNSFSHGSTSNMDQLSIVECRGINVTDERGPYLNWFSLC